jgi:hypothetical protein
MPALLCVIVRAATEPGQVYNVFFEVYVAADDLIPCTAPTLGGPLDPPDCFGNGALGE